MAVLLEGVLEISSKPSGKDWKQRYFVLKHHNESKRSTLDYYKDLKKKWRKQVPKGVISLWPWFQLSLAHNCSHKFPLKLTTPEVTVYLAAPTFTLMNRWFYHIQTQRTLEPLKKECSIFHVQAGDSDSMNLLGATGNCLLALTMEFEIICTLLPDKSVVGVWPFNCLRRYWCDDGVFVFEAGRRSPRGEGTYSFVTSQNEEIFRALEGLIEKAKKDNSSTSLEAVDDRPPAPLPGDGNNYMETPIPSSESDDERDDLRRKTSVLDNGTFEDPQLVSRVPLPQAGGHAKSTGSLKLPRRELADVSGHPTYFKRGRVNTGGHAYLHETVQPSKAGGDKPKRRSIHNQPLPPPPLVACVGEVIKLPDPLEEDTYSHTVHTVPAPFQRGRGYHDAVSASLYNALVHNQNPDIERKLRPSTVDDMALYDIAFPPTSSLRGKKLLPQDAEYGTVSSPTPNIPRTRMPIEKLSLGLGTSVNAPKEFKNPLYGSQEALLTAITAIDNSSDESPQLMKLPIRPRADSELMKGFQPTSSSQEEIDRGDLDAPPPGQLHKKSEEDGLTANPLYGSQDKLLDAIKAQALEDSVKVDSSKWYMPPDDGDKDKDGDKMASGERKASNPVYGAVGEVGPTLDETGDEAGLTMIAVRPSEANLDVPQTSGKQHEFSSREASPSDSPDGIPKDAKGYSQVDKNKKPVRQESVADSITSDGTDSAPPPIPERNYSWDSSTTDQN